MVLDATKPDGDDLVSALDTYGQEERAAINLNTSLVAYVDQDVTSGAAPTLLGTNFTAIPTAALSVGAVNASAGAGDACCSI